MGARCRDESGRGRRSRSKGKGGEREFARELGWALGLDARRGQQFQGSPESPDVVADALPTVHWEVKRCESLSLYAVMTQATEDAGEKIPVVAHRRNNREWLVVCRLGDLAPLAAALHRLSSENQLDCGTPPTD